eukprot:593502-Heterocapsa_arctica.AAC.1
MADSRLQPPSEGQQHAHRVPAASQRVAEQGQREGVAPAIRLRRCHANNLLHLPLSQDQNRPRQIPRGGQHRRGGSNTSTAARYSDQVL